LEGSEGTKLKCLPDEGIGGRSCARRWAWARVGGHEGRKEEETPVSHGWVHGGEEASSCRSVLADTHAHTNEGSGKMG